MPLPSSAETSGESGSQSESPHPQEVGDEPANLGIAELRERVEAPVSRGDAAATGAAGSQPISTDSDSAHPHRNSPESDRETINQVWLPNPIRKFVRYWKSECGPGELLKVAFPLVVSTISFTIMHFCDRMFVAWHSTDAVAAVMPAGLLVWSIFSLPMGIAGYSATFVAQYIGAGKPEKVGGVIWQAMRLGLYSTPLFLAIACVGPTLFRLFGHDPKLIHLETLYFQIVSFGSGAAVLGAALYSFFLGRGRTFVIMAVDSVAAIVNIVLDLVLIFGLGPIPALGLEGAAWATALAMWLKVLLFGWLVFRPNHRLEFGLISGRRFDLSLLWRLCRFGGPNGLQFVIEGSSITIFVLFLGRVGTEAAAATTLAFSVNMVAFVPVIGLGMAVSTLVGQNIGGKNLRGAVRATWSGMLLAITYTAFFATLYLACPDLFFAGFASGIEDFEQVRSYALLFLKFVAAYCILDAVQLIFVSTLKGAGDTLFVLFSTLGMALLLVTVGSVGTIWLEGGKAELYWWWGLITAWVWSIAILFAIRYFVGKWKSMSVIEHELTPEA